MEARSSTQCIKHKVLDKPAWPCYSPSMVSPETPAAQSFGPAVDFQRRISRIHDHIYASGHVKTPAAISYEFGKIFHTALYAEEVLQRSPAFQIPPSQLKVLLQNGSLLQEPFLAQLRKEYSMMNSAWHLYPEAEEITFSDYDVCFVCTELSGLVLSDHGRDLFGDATEVFRSVLVKRVGGQFFTDPLVTKLAMDLLEFDPRVGHDLVDICAGTGGFLLAGLNHIRHLLSTSDEDATEPSVRELALRSLKGQELDPEVCDAANATLRARLGISTTPIVSCGDSLLPMAFLDKGASVRRGAHYYAATNPPFGTKITVKNPEILEQFELARSSSTPDSSGTATVSPTPPDILFIERNIEILKPGSGRLAIVLPYQLLSGPKALHVRRWLLRHTRLIAVVDLPPETFQPHTGTKTALVVVERKLRSSKKLPTSSSYNVFMAIPRWIGHDRRGNPVFRRTPDGKLSDQVLCDFAEVEQAWQRFRAGNDPQSIHSGCFTVCVEQILSDPLLRMNALFHRPAEATTSEWFARRKALGWEFVDLGDLVSHIFFPGRFKRNYVEYREGAVPFLGGANITEFIVRTDKWLAPDDPKLSNLLVHTGWLLITRSGTTGMVSSVPAAWDGFAMSEHVIRVVPDPEKLDPSYLLAFLRSRFGQEQLARGVFGSVIDEITPEHVAKVRVPLPPKPGMVKKVVANMKEAEEHRQRGIERFEDAVECVSRLLSGA